MPNRRRSAPPTSSNPMAKVGKLMGGLMSARAGGAARVRSGGGRKAQASGLSKLLRAAKR